MRITKEIALIIIVLGLSVCKIYGQESVEIKGVVYDSATRHPVEYTNIGIFEKGIGTVSDFSGRFSINIPGDLLNDSITFSRIGYYKKVISTLKLQQNALQTIYLIPKTIQLEEVKIDAKKLKIKTKGNKTRSEKIVLGISSSLSLGLETGTVIKLPDKPVYIKDFNFHIAYNRPDSAKFRLNIYSYDKKIENNILKKNIYFTVSGKTTGDFKVDLTKYNLVVQGDVFVAIEELAVYSKGPDPKIKFDKYYYDRINVSATVTGSKSFYRKVSMDKWEKKSSSPGFWLTVAY